MKRYSNEKILTPPQIRAIVQLLFNKRRLSGGEIARTLHRDSNALWLDVHKYGLPVGQALKVASICEGWSDDLLDAARTLRLLTEGAELTKRDYSLSKRKVKPNRRPKLRLRRVNASGPKS